MGWQGRQRERLRFETNGGFASRRFPQILRLKPSDEHAEA